MNDWLMFLTILLLGAAIGAYVQREIDREFVREIVRRYELKHERKRAAASDLDDGSLGPHGPC